MRLWKLLATGCAIALCSQGALAQAYPTKPIRIIVAYQAGQGTDIATRYLGNQLAKELGQPVIVDNRPGAGGNLGTELAADAPPDGYTLTMGTNATHAVNQYLYSGVRTRAEKDFEPIVLTGSFPMVLAVNAKSPMHSITDLVGALKSDPRSADIATPSTSARLVIELLKERSSLKIFYVPYKGSGIAMTDVLGGQLPLLVDTPTALRSQLQAGHVRAIAVTSSVPSALVPGVKPVAEQGYAGFEVIAWNALFAPHGTPSAVLDTLNEAMNRILKRPETRQQLLEYGFDPGGGTRQQLADFVQGERRKWEPIIRTSGMKAD
ncbi:Tripartite-type tricarboxylate transporter, receptor component TctC [Variovorax sp. OK605]|jgi:tripartite-type tricarboxylate transporter receptor subunit TctC|uniref:Bug family tripartite tricarboxylate transporter substrate binding protein n=1 Tax=Variovorax sp. OK605 TaxID=1855317 RepID=UPI0008E3354C|nr:tripartite tricarboxylate transporter substrate binding protein [Variovorax sp. OK605]SFP54717.1 Tripartite-type tricarboxylate transporter, receptor component TctC [Variovorax sp. OK605]